MLTSIRRTFFDRLWERIIQATQNDIISTFHAHNYKWSSLENKKFGNFINALLLGLQSSTQSICLLDTVISEMLIIKVFDAIETIAKQEETSLLKLVVGQSDDQSHSGTGSTQSSMNEKVNKAVFDLLPVSPRLVPQNIEVNDNPHHWTIRRESSYNQCSIRLINDWSSENVIAPPDFLWRVYLAHE